MSIDYHIEVEGHYYSVPYQLIGKRVDVRISQDQVEVFHNGKRVAVHLRGRAKGQHTTEARHMPASHRAYKKSPLDLVEEAASIGDEVGELARAIMEAKDHPAQGYRAILGIIRLGKAYPKERVRAACARALAIRGYSYRSVRSILERGLDQVPLSQQGHAFTIEHSNIRGAGYYQGGEGC